MRCIPGECPHCVAWGFGDHVRCERSRVPPQRDGRVEDYMFGSGWFTTDHGTECFFAGPEQLSLAGLEAE